MNPMEEVIQIENRHYILADSPRADERAQVLKHGESFAILDRFGDIQPVGLSEEGLYHEGTRFLSRLILRLNGRPPFLLSSNLRQDNGLLSVNLTNGDLADAGGKILIARDMLHLRRDVFLFEG